MKPANRVKTDSKRPNKPTKRKAPKSAWKPGESGNPAGRPKDGESWTGVISMVANMTTDEIIEFIGRSTKLGKALSRLSRNVQAKYIVTAQIMAELMTKPSAGLWNGLMDRMDGKVKEHVDLTSNGKSIDISDDERIERVTALLEAARARRNGQSATDGQADTSTGAKAPGNPA